MKKKFTLNCNGKPLIAEEPLVMGILNITPDSFYAGSRFNDESEILKRAGQMIGEGADMLDIGGQSTRPGATFIHPEEELERVLPAIRSIKKYFPEVLLSIDTFSSRVAKEAVTAGASLINDVSGGLHDSEMYATAAMLHVPYICMHMKGNAQTMQREAKYEQVVKEVLDFFVERIALCMESGILDIILDPGLGFAKTMEHNFELLRNLPVFGFLGKPVLIGISRKSTIYKTLGITAGEALNGSTVMHTIALLQGADILRVHDVKEAKEVVKLCNAYRP